MGTVLNHSLRDLSAQNLKREVRPLVRSLALRTPPHAPKRPCPQGVKSCNSLLSLLSRDFPPFFFKLSSVTFFLN